MNFIVVDAYSPYTAIVGRPWLHALGAVFSTLHLKVKYPSRDQIKEFVGSQFMARQCLVAAILHQLGVESSTSVEKGLQQSKTLVLSVKGLPRRRSVRIRKRLLWGMTRRSFFRLELSNLLKKRKG